MLPSLVADMNIADPVIHFLREHGVDVVSAREEVWGDSPTARSWHGLTRHRVSSSLTIPTLERWPCTVVNRSSGFCTCGLEVDHRLK